MFLSVIIPTRNRAGNLKNALNSLGAQTLAPDCFEVLVIDNDSTDDTRSVTEGFVRRLSNVRCIREETPGLHAGRHRGMREARGDVLVYGDDDIIASPTWLQAIFDSFKDDEEVALIGGNNYPRFEGEPPWWVECLWRPRRGGRRFIAEFSVLDFGRDVEEIDPFYVWGCNFSIRKSVLLQAGGFHPDGMPGNLLRFRGDGESWVSQFVLQRGYRTFFVPNASVEHVVSSERMTDVYLKKRAFSQGVSDSYAAIRAAGAGWRPSKATLLKDLLRVLRDAIKWRLKPVRAWQWIQISLAAAKARREGFDWHQRETAQDASLLEWVLRRDYMDDNAATPQGMS